ncbi:cyclophilin-like protein [Gymnopus androsaceus JB14]|uniref:Cyclophilin-like protein n=1 Tax=Gymnopus androsaceus JB14 TaxID=1447944 RepID=A0A6A4ICC2_9AGAR|nr:cyclophilin-like protein [Gymnopus androsaceus JB14]
MGHGSNDRLYITHTEHSVLGSHSASSGFKAKQEAPHPGSRTPFDCCALSFQPFDHPVCARNADGTGTVFDLINIIPWLKAHDNTHPITKEPLTPADLIQLHYSRKASGEIHDPISFKPFSEHSHIVAIATTGNVFLADSIKGGKDLVDDRFDSENVITLQNPHGMPSASVPSQASSAAKPALAKVVAKPEQVTAVKSKEATPWNISPYSSGLPGASLTSTSVDPNSVSGAASKLVWDEEELMFESISNPPKGKGKEKDVGKRRAYARVVTSLGGSSLNLELFCEKGKYDNCLFHRLVPGFMVNTNRRSTALELGWASLFGIRPFRDEYDLKGAAKHDSRGILAMANKGANTNGSQFYFTFKPAPHLGQETHREDVLDALEKLPRKDGTDRPAKSVKITEIIIYQDPFEEYKTRLASKLAKRAEGPRVTKPEKKEGDDINWFGVKVGLEAPVVSEKVVGGGVGKYLNLKRPQAAAGVFVSEEPSKKRKTGFGNFEGW